MNRYLEVEVAERFPPQFEEENGFIDLEAAAAEAQARLMYEAYADDAAAAGTEEEGEEEEGELRPEAILSLKDYVLRDPLVFGDFRNFTNESEPRNYEDLVDYNAVFHLFTEILDEYCERKQK